MRVILIQRKTYTSKYAEIQCKVVDDRTDFVHKQTNTSTHSRTHTYSSIGRCVCVCAHYVPNKIRNKVANQTAC